MAALVTMVLLCGWLLAFLHINQWIAPNQGGEGGAPQQGGLQTFLSLEAYISRIDVLGVIIFALFSGFAAVNFPFTHLAPAHPVSGVWMTLVKGGGTRLLPRGRGGTEWLCDWCLI